MRGLEGRVAIVTGGAGLIGAAICQRLGTEGATVVSASRTAAKSSLAASAKSAKPTFAAEMDLADEASIRRAFEQILKTGSAPRILIANASLREGLNVEFEKIAHREFSQLFEVDIAGHFLLARLMAEHLPEGEPASIVFLSSIYGVSGMDPGMYSPGMLGVPPQYAAVKSAMTGFARHLASRWGSRGIRVNTIVAGGVLSERQTPAFREAYAKKTLLKRMARAEEIASAVAFLASEESSYITGACLAVDGGFTAW